MQKYILLGIILIISLNFCFAFLLPNSDYSISNIVQIPKSTSSILPITSAISTSFNTYIGDGTYFVTIGDVIKLNNSLKIKIINMSPAKPDSNYEINPIYLYIDVYYDALKLNANPLFLKLGAIPQQTNYFGYFYQDYGIGVELPNKNNNYPSKINYYNRKPYYKLHFYSPLSLGNKVTPYDLVNHCIDTFDDKNKAEIGCLVYVPFIPLQDEVKQSNNKLSLIMDSTNSNYLQNNFTNINYCYDYILSKLGFVPLNTPIPIRMKSINLDGKYVSSLYSGIITPFTKSTFGSCDKILVHEMTHYFISPFPLSTMYNEGLATYIQEQSINLVNTELKKENLVVGSNIVPTDNPNIGVSLINIIPKDNSYLVQLQYYLYIGNGWSPYFILNIKPGYASYKSYDQFVSITYLKNVDNLNKTVTINLYKYVPLAKDKLNCLNKGYQLKTGWKTGSDILYADESINPIIPYAKLSDYYYTYDVMSMYYTSACLWQDIDKNIGLQKIMSEIKSYRTYNYIPFSFWEYLKNNSMDINALKTKYSVNIDEIQSPSYIVPLRGNIGKY